VAIQPQAGIADDAGPPSNPQDRRLTWVVRGLCLTQIVGWGILYYAFPVLATSIEADTGWSRTTVTGAFSLALLVAAAAGIPVGRVLERHGPRWLMSAGSILGVLAIAGVALAPTLPAFAIAWLLAGVAMAGSLYAPAFAAVTGWFGHHRVKALTAVTLVAGLASTVFAPLTAALNSQFGWRHTYLLLALVLGATTIPTHLVVLRPPWPRTVAPEPTSHHPDTRTVSGREFVLLAIGFTISAVSFYAVLIDLVPLVEARGFSPSDAAIVLGVGGIGQVAGRLGYSWLARRLSTRARTVTVLVVGAVTTGLLAFVPGPLGLLVLASVLAGNARGIFTLLEATAVSDRWGTARFARLNGIFNAPLMVATAIAPFVGAGLASILGNYPDAFAVLAAIGVFGAALTTVSKAQPLSG
jgi:MFS family permease